MKYLFVAVSLLLTANCLFAQSDGANMEKYWKFRTDFREKFIKIGPLPGESLPAGALRPLDCVDNINSDGSGYGEMHWGDGMIRHGHYLGLLATEYRLLKNAGKDVTGVLNELYYALSALNRLDKNLEPSQDEFYNMSLNQDFNGFYLREDVPEDFATNHWGTDPIEMRCTYSVFYRNNNAAKSNLGGYINEGNSYQNVPSQDQMSSLLVGLSLVHKLVDDVHVKPTSSDDGFYIVAETKAIVHRLVSYAANHNWFLIDVNGWPVNNGGGDLVLTAYPILKAAERITGNTYNYAITRRIIGYRFIQDCLTGFGLTHQLSAVEQSISCANMSALQDFHMTEYLMGGGLAGPLNNQNTSLFQTWQMGGTYASAVNNSSMESFWENILPNWLGAMHDDWADDHKYNSFLPALNLTDFSLIEFETPLIKDYSATILFNLGVASGGWEQQKASAWADGTGNYQLELINAVLNDNVPSHPASFYRSFLDQMNISGPYQMKGMNWDEDGNNIYSYKNFHPNGWASEYRWTHPIESAGNHEGRNGMYHGIDYMLFHNLYWLKFNSGIQMTETNDHCPCSAPVTANPPSGLNSYQEDAYSNLNDKLSYLPTCAQSVLQPVNHTVTSVFTIQPKFSNYTDLGIYTTKYQTVNATVEAGGELKTRTRFVLCDNKTLQVKAGAKMAIEKNETIVNYNSTLDLAGELRVKAGTTLRLRSKLILRNSSMLIIEDGGQLIVDYGGVIEYYNGANFHTYGSTSKIVLRGIIRTMNAATFSIGTTQPNNSQRGKLIIEGTTAGFEALQPATFNLVGTGINDNFIEIAANSRILANNSNISYFRITGCSVKIGSNAYISAQRTFQATNVKFHADADNEGVTIKGGNSFLGCTFQNVPLIGLLTTPGTTAKLQVSESAFSNTGVNVNNGEYLVRVEGTGYSIGNCTFTAATGLAHLVSENLTQPSSVSGSSFTETGPTNALTITAIQEKSNIELTVKSTTFNQLYTGIFKKYNKLTLKCNTFSNNTAYNMSATNGCLVNMSTTDLGGYNVLHKPAMNRSVSLSGSNIALANGYNYISDDGTDYIISGTLASPCTGLGCLFSASLNQWNSGNTAPPFTRFSLTSSNGNNRAVLTDPVALKPACGFFDTPGGGGTTGRFFYDYDGMPLIWSASENDSVRLNAVVTDAIHLTTAYDSLGNDLLAIERFNEVFTNELDLTDSITHALAWQGFYHMKSAVETAIALGQITATQNSIEFESHVAMYVNALMILTDSVIDEDNYLTQFYHEIDKAHLFRVIGHSQIGLNILDELEYCGLDSTEQAEINYWKTQFSEDLVIEAVGETAVDSVIVIDTNGYITPALAVNAYSFGANIQGLNEINYPNCDFFEHRNARITGDELLVYPNPAVTSITVQLPGAPGKGKLAVLQSDGRTIVVMRTDAEQSRSLDIRVDEWNPGTYQVHYTDPTGRAFTAKLVVQ